MALNDKEKDFAYNYIAEPNAYQAALNAGYKNNTAKYAYEWLEPTLSNSTTKRHLPYKKELHDFIKELRAEDEKKDNAILSRKEKKQILAEIARDTNISVADRIKAIDTDNKMDGEYTNNINIGGNINNPMAGLTTEELKKLINDG